MPSPERCFFLAFDHRAAFARALEGADVSITPAVERQMIEAKRVIFDAACRYRDRRDDSSLEVGVLVDEQYGAAVARRAGSRDLILAMPVERADQAIFTLEYGDEFGAHIEAFSPTFVKALVRFNPEGDAGHNATQVDRLRTLCDWLAADGRELMFELVIPPTERQLRGADSAERFIRDRRPALMLEAIVRLQDGGIEPTIWKLEGIDDVVDARAVAAAARDGDRDAVRCVVLGSGEAEERVEHWIDVAGHAEGYSGFAIGRTIWGPPLRDYLAGRSTRSGAVATITDRFGRYVERFELAATQRSEAPGV